MKVYKTSTGPKTLFRMFLNKQKIAGQNFQGIGQKVADAAHRKKADSPGRNLELIGFSLVIFVISLVGTFIFVWYTALKRNLLKRFSKIAFKSCVPNKMPRIKTVENKRKAGRPKLAPSTTVSFRIPIHLKNQVENRYGKHWPQIFKDFIAVLLAEDKG